MIAQVDRRRQSFCSLLVRLERGYSPGLDYKFLHMTYVAAALCTLRVDDAHRAARGRTVFHGFQTEGSSPCLRIDRREEVGGGTDGYIGCGMEDIGYSFQSVQDPSGTVTKHAKLRPYKKAETEAKPLILLKTFF